MTRVSVATWNIRKCIGLDRRRDPHRTARVIDDFEADVVVLQEADKRLGRRPAALTEHIIAAETDLAVVDAGGHEPSIGWHGNAVLVKQGTVIKDLHALHLPGLEPRGALVVDMVVRGCGLRVVAVHLGFVRRFRRRQLATIRSRLLAMEDCPTIILGDFNEWSNTGGFEPLTGFQVHAAGSTFHAARPVAALDRIATNQNVRVLDMHVVETRLTRVASDHLPLCATIELVDR